MDEHELADALRRATDDVTVPRDLVRHAERLGRERRARRRSRVAALSVGVVVLAGGALVVQQGIGGSSGASSTSGSVSSAGGGSAGSDAGAAGSDAAPSSGPYGLESRAPAPTFQSGPQSGSGQASGEAAAPGPAMADPAGCRPSLTVDGVPSGRTASVRAGGGVEVVGAPSCGPAPTGTRYVVVLTGAGGAPTPLADVTPAADGSFDARVTLPAATPPGPAVLFVRGRGEQRSCSSVAECPDAVDLDVAPAPQGLGTVTR